MSNLRYTEEHEWVRLEGDTAVVGISQYAQEQLGDVVYVELPEVGRKVEKGKEMAVVESVKAASEVYAPVSGEVVAVNQALAPPRPRR
jgi:glycine cleavage system H protein